MESKYQRGPRYTKHQYRHHQLSNGELCCFVGHRPGCQLRAAALAFLEVSLTSDTTALTFLEVSLALLDRHTFCNALSSVVVRFPGWIFSDKSQADNVQGNSCP
eukprot:scpid81868/ scgid7896/ 